MSYLVFAFCHAIRVMLAIPVAAMQESSSGHPASRMPTLSSVYAARPSEPPLSVEGKRPPFALSAA